MTIFDILSLICGLALFLYGMDVMSDALKRSAGNQLKTILSKMTSNPVKGFLLGLGVTVVIQSSSATTVMVVGFVNSGTMSLTQSIGVIMGSNVGSAATAWLTGLSGIGSAAAWLKPSSWTPIIAIVSVFMLMFVKRGKKRDIATILLGFTVLMVGMEQMSGAVEPLKNDASFQSILMMFDNPVLGLMAGLVLTAIVQSSAASVGILQTLTATGMITYGTAIPIVMGQNIGTCVTALLSSISANKNGKRAAMIHLLFNVISSVIWLVIFVAVQAIFDLTAFTSLPIDMFGVAGVHTVFKFLAVLVIAPIYKKLETISKWIIRDKKDETLTENLLDPRLLTSPTIAVERATEVTISMAKESVDALLLSMEMLGNYDVKKADAVRQMEEHVDVYEDELGTYLVQVAACNTEEADSHQITKLLHMIGDFERISDHAVNILESAEEIRAKKLEFSEEANHELAVLSAAVRQILSFACDAFVYNDLAKATEVEPLEQVVDDLRDQIKHNHILRLQNNTCTIEHGFVLNDLLTNFERVSDHCSNIGGCVIEISRHDAALDMHRYLTDVKAHKGEFEAKYKEYTKQYSIVSKE